MVESVPMTLTVLRGGQGGTLLARLEKHVSRFLDILDKLGDQIEESIGSADIKRRDQTRQIEVYGRSITSMLAEARAFIAMQEKTPPKLNDEQMAAELKEIALDTLQSLTFEELNNLLRARGLCAVNCDDTRRPEE